MKTISLIFAGLIGSYLGFVVIPDNPIYEPIKTESLRRDSVVVESEPQTFVTDSLSILIEGMIQVESRGNECAYNRREDAVGCLQIRPIMVREVNRLLGSEVYTMNDRWDCDKSVEMFLVVVEHHHPDGSFEGIARCWNGGPNGMRMESTKTYWKKVLSRIGSS